MGAGSVGCYLGGVLAAAGATLHFVGRPRVLDGLREQGLRVSDLEGRIQHLPAATLHLHATPPAGLVPDITLLCVKSGATAEAAALLQQVLPAGSLVLSMQNGMNNAERGRQAAPGLDWRAGMVPFNVAELGPGQFHRGTVGGLAVQGQADELPLLALRRALAGQGLELQLRPDLRALQWGKLLLNLNNPVNALSGLPLRAQLLQRGYRRCFAALQGEALDLLEAAGFAVEKMTPLPPRLLLHLLRLPTPLFRLLAARMLKIDAKARSSMADDLALGRSTEIDALCGEVVRLAAGMGRSAPLNARMQALLQAWPQRQRPYGPQELWTALTQL
ncbi:2-dehydropantoate 2-reductase [Paucibacter sp. AS339]|uniref:2-dehydropantoate 2-reductase n=1 Tax=Paucibacter hankyongi TaxID=3133434 RepID=UPI00309A8107